MSRFLMNVLIWYLDFARVGGFHILIVFMQDSGAMSFYMQSALQAKGSYIYLRKQLLGVITKIVQIKEDCSLNF